MDNYHLTIPSNPLNSLSLSSFSITFSLTHHFSTGNRTSPSHICCSGEHDRTTIPSFVMKPKSWERDIPLSLPKQWHHYCSKIFPGELSLFPAKKYLGGNFPSFPAKTRKLQASSGYFPATVET
ncbi:hypothetical protein DVH24_003583 [Malus domestica]|uniref:Uncharacterized protein n=1 Tax=Malus domestica TaxID=3750 RepID=A0A498ILQ9_MALDO|nr:hypothetical protein DVH24_003583 [Malus domestica]